VTTQDVVLGLLGLVAVASALLVVTTRQIVHAALWLVVTLGSIAGCYLVLAAEFVAWVQVLIYVGAVVVLLLFGLMLTRAPIGVSDELDAGPVQRVLGALVAGATAGVLVTTLVDGFRDRRIELPSSGGSAKSVGTAIFQSWVLAFELLSVLLLAALIGAVVLSRRDIGAQPDTEVEG
jgi:NADH-quinone oxidoreductase subunit J